MTTSINVDLPTLEVSQALQLFPELDPQQAVDALTTAEGTITMKQEKDLWNTGGTGSAAILQIFADSEDFSDTADGDDIKYKINGEWPASYSADGANNSPVNFKDAAMTGDHVTLDDTGSSTASGATTLAEAMRFNLSEDFLGNKSAFDIFSNEEELETDFNNQSDELQDAVAEAWLGLKNADTTESTGVALGAGILSNATGASANPVKAIVQAILNTPDASPHPAKATIASNLAARADPSAHFADVELEVGDKLNFTIKYLAVNENSFDNGTPGAGAGLDVPSAGLGGAGGSRPHTFKVVVEIVDNS